MCEKDDLDAMQRAAELSRRRFNTIGLGVGALALLPRAAQALDTSDSEVSIKTPDGNCDAHFVHPASGAHAAVLVWPDIFGLRPAFKEMGKRLAENGYAVLTVNPFYRVRKAPTSAAGASFNDPATRTAMNEMRGSITAKGTESDAKAYVAWLDAQASVDKGRKIGTTGYCMGGPLVIQSVAAVPERFGAGATFHGGGLTTTGADSPHLLIPKTKASYLIAIADNDDQRDPNSKDILRKTFDDAKLEAEIEVYKGAQHGWCPIDGSVYHPELAAKAWYRLIALFGKALAKPA